MSKLPQIILVVLVASFSQIQFASAKAPKSISYVTYQNWMKKCLDSFGLKGDAKKQAIFHTNELKNSFDSPSTIDPTITLKVIAKDSKNDRKRFTEGTAVEITGYVFDVIPGGAETCNCHAKEKEFNDTHIPLVKSLKDTSTKNTVVIEVTPQIRHYMDSVKHIDWSTKNLGKIRHKKIRVKGFLLFDAEHKDEAMNTDPQDNIGKDNWRKTCWEVHPITSITVLKSNGDVDQTFSTINGEYR